MILLLGVMAKGSPQNTYTSSRILDKTWPTQMVDIYRLSPGAEMPLRLDIKRRLTARFVIELEC